MNCLIGTAIDFVIPTWVVGLAVAILLALLAATAIAIMRRK